MAERQHWMPLESNPETYHSWAASMGFDMSKYQFNEVYGFDADLLAFIPRPVIAVLMLFPTTAGYDAWKKEEDKRLKADPSKVALTKDFLYFKQMIGNACGTMGLLHALTNCGVQVGDNVRGKLMAACQSKTPVERGRYLETCSELESAHNASATSGQTATLSATAQTYHHFTAFVERDGRCIELDGDKSFPVDRGAVSAGLLETVIEHTQFLMTLSEGNIDFNLIALTPIAD